MAKSPLQPVLATLQRTQEGDAGPAPPVQLGFTADPGCPNADQLMEIIQVSFTPCLLSSCLHDDLGLWTVFIVVFVVIA
jgi:hypothetical protein